MKLYAPAELAMVVAMLVNWPCLDRDSSVTVWPAPPCSTPWRVTVWANRIGSLEAPEPVAIRVNSGFSRWLITYERGVEAPNAEKRRWGRTMTRMLASPGITNTCTITYSPWGPTTPRWIGCHSSLETADSRWSTISAPASIGLTVPVKVTRLATPVSRAALSAGP